MEALELETVLVVAGLAIAAIALPMTVIALHQHKRRSYERAAGRRRKEKIRLSPPARASEPVPGRGETTPG